MGVQVNHKSRFLVFSFWFLVKGKEKIRYLYHVSAGITSGQSRHFASRGGGQGEGQGVANF
jgi:hypothetical protein